MQKAIFGGKPGEWEDRSEKQVERRSRGGKGRVRSCKRSAEESGEVKVR